MPPRGPADAIWTPESAAAEEYADFLLAHYDEETLRLAFGMGESAISDKFLAMQTQCLHDLARWCDEYVLWGKKGTIAEGKTGITQYQREIFTQFMRHPYMAVKSLHGTGKSTMACLVIHWFANTRRHMQWKAITTAWSLHQAKNYLWKDIHDWADALDWEAMGLAAYDEKSQLLKTSLTLPGGAVTTAASKEGGRLEGLHGPQVLVVVDEAKGVGDHAFDAIDGASSNAWGQMGYELYAFVISTPSEPTGRFYAIHTDHDRYSDWLPYSITLEEGLRDGIIDPAWVEKMKKRWGESSPIYQNKVRGKFAASDTDGIIPTEDYDAACERWDEWARLGKPGTLVAIGVDVAHGGEADTVLSFYYHYEAVLRDEHGELLYDDLGRIQKKVIKAIDRQEKVNYADSIRIATFVYHKWLRTPTATIILDSQTWGIGVYDLLYKWGATIYGFRGNTRSHDPKRKRRRISRHDEREFFNERALAYHVIADMLSPARQHPNDPVLALPRDDDLFSDLCSIHRIYTPLGEIKIENKLEIMARRGKPIDAGDSAMMAVFFEFLHRRKTGVWIGKSSEHIWG